MEELEYILEDQVEQEYLEVLEVVEEILVQVQEEMVIHLQ